METSDGNGSRTSCCFFIVARNPSFFVMQIILNMVSVPKTAKKASKYFQNSYMYFFECVRVYVCIRVCVDTHTHTHTHSCTHTNAHTHEHTHTHMHTCTHTHTHIYICIHVYLCIHVYVHVHLCTYTYTYTHSHSCTHAFYLFGGQQVCEVLLKDGDLFDMGGTMQQVRVCVNMYLTVYAYAYMCGRARVHVARYLLWSKSFSLWSEIQLCYLQKHKDPHKQSMTPILISH